jgi:AcrR family transcriptional regulator
MSEREELQRAPRGATARRGGRPARLSRAAIFAAAIELIEASGAEALTMRALADSLGVEAMSLYRHVASREALLDGIAGQLMSKIEPRGVSSDWAAAVRGYASAVRGLARTHPATFALVAYRAPESAGALQPVEDLLASLRAAGFTPARAVSVYRLIAAYTRGYVLAEIGGFALDEQALGQSARLPSIRALARQLTGEPGNGSFRAGLETIINGLRTEREP